MHLNFWMLTVPFISYFLPIDANKTDTEKSDFGGVHDDVYKKTFTTDIKGERNKSFIVQKFDDRNFKNNSMGDENVYQPSPISNYTIDSAEYLGNDEQKTTLEKRHNRHQEESVTVSLQNFSEDMDAPIFSVDGNRTDSTENTTDYSERFTMQESNNNQNKEPINFLTKVSRVESEVDSTTHQTSTRDLGIKKHLMVTQRMQESRANSRDSEVNLSIEKVTSKDELQQEDNSTVLHNFSKYTDEVNYKERNEKIEKNSKAETLILKNSDDIDMEFENIFEDYENNVMQYGVNINNRHPKSVDSSFSFDESDVLRDSEISHEKYISPGIESASLIIGATSRVGPSTSTSTSSFNYSRTTYLLSSDVEMSDGAFFISRSDSGKTDELELQDDVVATANTHEAAVSRISVDKAVYLLQSLTIEMSERNSLWLNPNARQDLYYEVTNNLNSASRVSFKVTDERSILWSMDKYNSVLGPHGSTTVRLTVIPRTDVDTDTIIFNAFGAETVKKVAIVHVNKDTLSDDSYPNVDYSYTSDCTDVGLSDCHHSTWTIKVSARDQESGLMLLTTNPKGLHFPNGYTAGTTEEVTGYFSDTCCNPDLQILAVDTLNNRILKQANAYKAPLSFWAIIAIVLVSLIILIIIIAIVIYCVIRCKQKEAGSFDLPVYRGRSRY